MMVTALFLCSYLLLSWVFLMWAMQKGHLAPALLGVTSRLVLCVVGLGVVLPFGGADAMTFESVAWQWSQGSFSDVVRTFDPSRSYVISTITALFYFLLERNLAIPVLINGMLGIVIMYLGLRLADRVWPDEPRNSSFAILLALHPMLNVHSAVVLRENYILVFLLVACIFLARVVRSGNLVRLVPFIGAILAASAFHGGMFLFAAGLPVYYLVESRQMGVAARIVLVVASVALIGVLFYYLDFGKLADVQQGNVDLGYLVDLERTRSEANTAYLVGMTPGNAIDVFWQVPVRIFFFLFKPFLWDIRAIGHALVFLDAVLWVSIVGILIANFTSVRRNPVAFVTLICCVVTIAAFAYGTGNFGTGVRHRTKFLIPLLVIIYPFIPRVRFRRRIRG